MFLRSYEIWLLGAAESKTYQIRNSNPKSNPEDLGRFINADSYASTGQGFLGYNMFAYCGNNPAALSDHSGEHPLWQALFDDSDPGFIHRRVQEDIVTKETMKGYSIGKERGVYNDDGEMVGRVDIYNSQTGQIWEVKYKTNPIEAAEKAASYCGLVLEGCEHKTSLGNAGRFDDSFTIGCGEYSYTVNYWTPEPGVILYSVSGPKKKVPDNSYYYVPRASKEKDSTTIIAIGIPVGIGAFGGCALAFCGGGGYQCRPLYE